jgi:hypothetical protein
MKRCSDKEMMTVTLLFTGLILVMTVTLLSTASAAPLKVISLKPFRA